MDWMLIFVFTSIASDTVVVQTERFALQEDCVRVGDLLVREANAEGSRQSYRCEEVSKLR